jgi:hypothetical protein
MQKVEVLLSAQVEDAHKAQALCGRVMRYAKKLGLKVEGLENKFMPDEEKSENETSKYGNDFPGRENESQAGNAIGKAPEQAEKEDGQS